MSTIILNPKKIDLRRYQSHLYSGAIDAWQIYRNILAVLPTGGGKTVLFCNILANHKGVSVAIAHRQELVSQMSLTLAKYGVRHRVIADSKIIRWLSYIHMTEFGRSYIDQSALCAVAGVDTLTRRTDQLCKWAQQVTLWIIDEGHHVLKKNKWGKAVAMFPNAKGLGVTATPCRADGAGLGEHADGVFNFMVVGPTARQLINQGYLSDFKIFAPVSDFTTEGLPIDNSGDFSRKQLKIRTRQSKIIGSIVDEYIKRTPGKLGITFASDTETAADIAANFRQKHVPAEVITAKTKPQDRINIQRRFRRHEVLQLVNVDIFDEGYDVPELEVVSMGRATASFNKFSQQLGRVLRPGKPYGIIIDHVGNTTHHCRTERDNITGDIYISLNREWSLDRRDKRMSEKDPDLIPVRTCRNVLCCGVYEAYRKICPFCGAEWAPSARSTPEQVDGDLTELSPEALAFITGEIKKVNEPLEQYKKRLSYCLSGPALGGAVKNHRLRQEAQTDLRNNIALWAGYQRSLNRPDHESYTRFYYRYGIDVMTAQTLKRAETEELNNKIVMDILKGVI